MSAPNIWRRFGVKSNFNIIALNSAWRERKKKRYYENGS